MLSCKFVGPQSSHGCAGTSDLSVSVSTNCIPHHLATLSLRQMHIADLGLSSTVVSRHRCSACAQEAVRGDFGDVADLLLQAGAMVFVEDEQKLVPLENSDLAR